MTIVKIESTGYYNGHSNQTMNYEIKVPFDYAVLPKEIGTPETIPNFPFGLIEVDKTQDPKVITKWTPTEMPPEPEPEKTVENLITDAINDI